MAAREIDLARQSLSLFGIEGTLKKVAAGLDITYRVKSGDGRVFALRCASGMFIRKVSAFATEAAWIAALATDPWFDVPKVQPGDC